jgi:hypothetical protein
MAEQIHDTLRRRAERNREWRTDQRNLLNDLIVRVNDHDAYERDRDATRDAVDDEWRKRTADVQKTMLIANAKWVAGSMGLADEQNISTTAKLDEIIDLLRPAHVQEALQQGHDDADIRAMEAEYAPELGPQAGSATPPPPPPSPTSSTSSAKLYSGVGGVSMLF